MPTIEVYHREGCTLPHWRRGERLRWFFSAVRCSGKPEPIYRWVENVRELELGAEARRQGRVL